MARNSFRLLCRRCFCSTTKQQQPAQPLPPPSSSPGIRAPRASSHTDPYIPSSQQLALSQYMQRASTKESRISRGEKLNLFFRSVYKSFRETSLTSKLVGGSLFALCIFGDYLDRHFLEHRDANGVYSFLADSPEDTIMQELRTGDVVVFQRPLFSFNPLNILRTSFRQFACHGPFDHCGVVIHNGHDGDFPYILEIDQNYRSQFRITAFDERILTAREKTIFARRLCKERMRAVDLDKLSDWIDYKVSGASDDDSEEEQHNQSYIEDVEEFLSRTVHTRDSLLQILGVLCFNGDNTVKIRSAIRDLTRRIKVNEYEIATQIDRPQQSPIHVSLESIKDRRYGRVKTSTQLIDETRRLRLQRVLKKDNLKKREAKIRSYNQINSAAFVGYFWRYLGLLEENGAKPWEIRPGQFADPKLEIPLVGSTRLGAVSFVKTAYEDKKINDAERPSYRDIKAGKYNKHGCLVKMSSNAVTTAIRSKAKNKSTENASIALRKKGKKQTFSCKTPPLRRAQSTNVFLQSRPGRVCIKHCRNHSQHRKVERKLGPVDIGRIKYEGSKYEETGYDFLAEKLHKHSRSSSFKQRKMANPVKKRQSVRDIGAPNCWELPLFYHEEQAKIRAEFESRLSFLHDSKPMHVPSKKRAFKATPKVEYLRKLDQLLLNHDTDDDDKYDDEFYLRTPCLSALYESSGDESEISGLSDFADSVENDMDRQMTEALDEILRASSATPPNSNLGDVQETDDAIQMNINMYVNSDELDELMSIAADDHEETIVSAAAARRLEDDHVDDGGALHMSDKNYSTVAKDTSSRNSDNKRIGRKQLLETVQSNLKNIQSQSPTAYTLHEKRPCIVEAQSPLR